MNLLWVLEPVAVSQEIQKCSRKRYRTSGASPLSLTMYARFQEVKFPGKHKLEGIRAGFVPSICRLDLADEIVPVKDEDAYETARKLARAEGIFGGITSGANVWCAIQKARIIGPGKKIVTVICDSGLKYLNGDLYK